MVNEFEEIGHSGGKVTFVIGTDQQGRRAHRFGIRLGGNRASPSSWIAVYALLQGIPVGLIELGGVGQPLNPSPCSGCVPVFIGSDSEGKFGHHCPSCGGYWRSGPWPNMCPYCAIRAPGYQFLSEAQQSYVRQYCDLISHALASGEDTEVCIDMDSVADAVGKKGEKPAFYVSEQSQQCKFTCNACDEFNDILGRFGYCSRCGTRNDLADFEGRTIPTIRTRLNSADTPEDCVRDAVSAFDSFMAQVAKQLARITPLTGRRRQRLLTQSFHKLDEICTTFRNWFDIDMCAGMVAEERRAVELMFFRRHLYEHNGGEVDQKYLNESGDNSVQLGQRIHETQEGAHQLLGSLVKMARNVHCTFHEMFPPLPEPIKEYQQQKERIAKYGVRPTP